MLALGACDCGSSHTAPDAGADGDTRDATVSDAASDAPPADAIADAPSHDAPPDVRAADGGECVRWHLGDATELDIRSLEAAPVNTERTARVAIETDLNACDMRATPQVTYASESREVFIDMRVWHPEGIDCPPGGTVIERPVSLRLDEPGTWTVRGGAPGGSGPSLEIDVGVPPPRSCDTSPGVPCGMDCDCPDGVCLSGFGLGGPFTACARACELDRDCGGDSVCASPDDGLELTCRVGPTECGEARPPCPEGFSCMDGACEPTFRLGSDTRTPCECDADCTPPLRCIAAADPDDEARCEMACPTGGPWCAGPGAHFCGSKEQDLSGLAPDDSVCVFAGE